MQTHEDRGDWAEQLRGKGYRITPQRQLVLQAVDELGHATPEEIHAHVQAQAAGVNVSTVYRTLEVLEGVGLVTHAHIAHGSPTYHSVREEQHVHLVCRTCDSIDSVPASEVADLLGHLERAQGFTPDISHLTIHGRCVHCRESTAGHERSEHA